MPNSSLEDKYFKVPDNVFNRVNQVLKTINANDGHAKGLQRAKDIISDRKSIVFSNETIKKLL